MANQLNADTSSQIKTILTIDDEADIRNSFRLFLEDLGYQVLEAADGAAGLELAAQQHPDLALLDLRMPGIDGFDCLQSLREKDPELPLIVISGTGASHDVVRALQLGAWDFILKPIKDLQLLRHCIEKALEQARLKKANLAYQRSLEVNIAERTRQLHNAYEELVKSEQKYRSIYENLQDIYYEVALDGTLLEVSPSVEKNSLYKREELLGSNLYSHYANPQDRKQFLQLILEQGQVSDYQIELINKDGTPMHLSANAVFYPEKSGQPAYVAGILRNITKRKLAEEALRNSQQTLEALFNAAPLAILAYDSDLRITLWNNAAEEIFGWRREDIIGRPYPLASPEQEREAHSNLRRALAGEEFKGLKLERRHKDGHMLQLSLSSAPLRDAANRICGVIGIFEDISEEQRLRGEAERQSRLASLGELAAGVAHEINNPNGIMLLNLPTIRDFVLDAIKLQRQFAFGDSAVPLGGLAPEQAATAFPKLMDDFEDSARRIKQIVADLKDFSRQEDSSRDEPFDLNTSAQKAIRLAANNLKNATVAFHTEFAAGIPAVSGSAQRIEQVIVNLLVNACEALTNQEQSILLRTSYDSQRQEACLEVRDSGSGISKEQLPHVTDPFFTTRREAGGTGLGLSVSARIIKEHAGRLQLSSEVGTGTRVCFYLPTAQKARSL